LKNFLFSIAIDVALAGAFYMWQVLSVDSARTFFVFVMWFFTGFLALATFGGKPKHRVNAFRMFHGCVVAIALLVAMLYAGLTTLAICYFVAWLLVQAKYTSTETA